MTRTTGLAAVILSVFCLGLVRSAIAAPVPAWTLTFDSPFSNGSWSFGDLFTVGSQNISVTSLGAYDAGGDGFVSSGGIPVGIFRESDGTLLTSTMVSSTDPLQGHYRFHPITPVELLANTQYRVVAVSLSDLYNIQTNTPDTVDTRITWDRYGYCSTTSLTSCDSFTGTERTWLANFELDDANSPPVASCVESVNPSGKNTPPAGSTTLPGSKGGQNEDGFYELVGEDEQDGTAPVFVTNASGSATFGPFSSGSVVKITEAPGRTPTAKPMGGPNSAVAAHITLDSDAFVFAVDSFGEESPVVSCLVPPLPK